MTTAFYAPLKAPDHSVPSGDRRMAQLLMQALDGAGAAPELVCRLRTYDRGDERRQARLDRLSQRCVERVVARPQARAYRAWFTYHCYHKAPDGLGPRVVRRLDLPYVIAEASIAAARAQGPWALGYRLAERAIAAADVVVAMSRRDALGLEDHVGAPARLVLLPPFTVVPTAWAPAADVTDTARFVTVAMMRPGAKERSYALLAEALGELRDHWWSLDVVGDGAARSQVEAVFERHIPGRVRYHGRIDDPRARDEVVRGATAFLWPAIDEAYGMALLEAQALGVPVVAGDGHGVPDIIDDGKTGLLAPVGDGRAFKDAISVLLASPARARVMGEAALRHVEAGHSVERTAGHLASILDLAGEVHAGRRR